MTELIRTHVETYRGWRIERGPDDFGAPTLFAIWEGEEMTCVDRLEDARAIIDEMIDVRGVH